MGDTDILPVRVQNVLDMEIIRLNLWSIKFSATNIKLEGFVRNEEGTMMQKVCSEVICKRMNSTMLFDVSGRFFELSGQIDREFQIKNGMPSRIVDEFMNGFPENWAFLISNCLTTEQRSAIRPIRAAPVQPLRPREPIVTLADETELPGDRTMSKKETERERKNKERDEEERKQALLEENRQRDRERELQKEKEREAVERRKKEEREEAERKRKEDEDAANYTFRAPPSFGSDAITPIRFTRGKKGAVVTRIFDDTPVRSTGQPLASSTPQRSLPVKEQPPQLPKQLKEDSKEQQPPPRQVERPMQSYASDADLFAVPRLPSRAPAPTGLSGGFDVLDEMDSLFDNAKIEKTPVMGSRRKPIPRRYQYESSPPPFLRGQSSSQQAYERDLSSASYYSSRYDDNRSRMSRRDDTSRRYDSGRDESRMSRKRGHYSPPDRRDDYAYNRRREDESRQRDSFRYDEDYNYDSKRSRPREASSSSGRSVRFEDDYCSNRSRENKDRRNHERVRDQRDRNMYESRELKEIMRKEKELEAKLRSKRSSVRRVSYSSDDSDNDTMADEWERENQEMLDNSMIMDRKPSNKRKNVPKKETSKPKRVEKPTRAPAKKNKKDPVETDDLNDSIASNRPRRACVTPSTPAPKRITWPKRDLDKLRHVIELKKPSGNLDDWAEVTRLLKKAGVEPTDVKQIAETKLKWKEPVQNEEALLLEEEEEKKRRRGAAAKVREGVRMHEEMRNGGKKEDDLRSGVESMEDYQPDDMDADQSLLALATPVAAKKKGGTRASIMPQPVEDSPAVKGNNTSSFMNSPKLDSTKVKEVETTLKYVQHLSTLQARPGSSMNKSHMNRSTSRGKNTSISVEQGARKAMKIINRGTTIHEGDEDDEDDDDEVTEDDEENVIY